MYPELIRAQNYYHFNVSGILIHEDFIASPNNLIVIQPAASTYSSKKKKKVEKHISPLWYM